MLSKCLAILTLSYSDVELFYLLAILAFSYPVF